jgi:hypothetical protein
MTPTHLQAACQQLLQRAGHFINTTAAHWQLLTKEAS